MSAIAPKSPFGLFLDHLEINPQAIALIDRYRVMTYGELNGVIGAFRSAIQSVGLPDSGSVAVGSTKDPYTIALILALYADQVPVLIVPEGLGEDAKRTIYKQAGVIAEMSASKGRVQTVIKNDCPAVCADESLRSKLSRTAFILTTSGAAGMPKGVMLGRAETARFFDWAQQFFDLTVSTKVLSYAPLDFDCSLLEVWSALAAGGTVILVDSEQAADARSVKRLVFDYAPDLIQGVPLLYKLLTHGGGSTFHAVRHVVTTGERVSLETRAAIVAAFPDSLFHTIYGATETNDSFALSAEAAEFLTAELPIGMPISSTEYLVIDENDRLVAAEGSGVLHVATPFQSLGYTDEALSQAAFHEHEVGGRPLTFYRTGDIVQRDAEGAIWLAARRDLIIQVQGVSTNIRDVESALAKSPDVELAIVCPVIDECGEVSLHAVVSEGVGDVCHAGAAATLRRYSADDSDTPTLKDQFALSAGYFSRPVGSDAGCPVDPGA